MAVTFLPISFTTAANSALRYEDVRVFVHKPLGRGKTDPTIAASNECNLSFKLTHTGVSFVVLGE